MLMLLLLLEPVADTVEDSIAMHPAVTAGIIGGLIAIVAVLVRFWIYRVDDDVKRGLEQVKEDVRKVDAHNSRQDAAIAEVRDMIVRHHEVPHLNLEGRDVLTRTALTAQRVEASLGELKGEIRDHIVEEREARKEDRVKNESDHREIMARIQTLEDSRSNLGRRH